MNDFTAETTSPDGSHQHNRPASSQVIDPSHDTAGAVGNGHKAPEADAKEPAKPLSRMETIEKAHKDLEAKTAAEKPAVAAEAPKEAKEPPPRAEGGKFAAKEAPADAVALDKSAADKPATGQAEDGDKRPSEGRQYAEPPARFLPEAGKLWANVPNSVKAEVHRLTTEHDAEVKRVSAEWEPVRKYDEMAKQSGTTLDKALEAYVSTEQQLRSNDPATKVAAINRVIQMAGVTPEQYAAFITQNPQAARTQAPQPQQPAPDPQYKALEQRLASFETQMAAQKVEPIITSFASAHNDYYSLQEPIAKVLQSGIVDQIYGAGLSPEQKLEVAYQMAGGRGSPSHQPTPVSQVHSAPVEARPVDPDGQKSIKGAPTGGNTTESPRRKFSRQEAVEAALAEAGFHG